VTTTAAAGYTANVEPETPAAASEPPRITDPAALVPQRRTGKKFTDKQLLRPGLLRPGTTVKARRSGRIGVVMPYDVRDYTEGFPVTFAGVYQLCCLDDVQPP
jgi:hypothetical protein